MWLRTWLQQAKERSGQGFWHVAIARGAKRRRGLWRFKTKARCGILPMLAVYLATLSQDVTVTEISLKCGDEGKVPRRQGGLSRDTSHK